MNALADVANTKAAAAAGSPMPPPPPTPGTSGKKRKRSAAAAARDKLVTGKKYQTYKLYEKLQSSKILDDPSELGKLKKYLLDMAIRNQPQVAIKLTRRWYLPELFNWI